MRSSDQNANRKMKGRAAQPKLARALLLLFMDVSVEITLWLFCDGFFIGRALAALHEVDIDLDHLRGVLNMRVINDAFLLVQQAAAYVGDGIANAYVQMRGGLFIAHGNTHDLTTMNDVDTGHRDQLLYCRLKLEAFWVRFKNVFCHVNVDQAVGLVVVVVDAAHMFVSWSNGAEVQRGLQLGCFVVYGK